MSESLTQEELGALLGDDAGDKASDNFDVFTGGIKNSLSDVKSVFSQKLGEEVDVQLVGAVEKVHAVAAPGAGSWYAAKGSVAAPTGAADYAVLYAQETGYELAKRTAGVEDMEDTIENVGHPLRELSETVIEKIIDAFGNAFSATVGEFFLYENAGAVEISGNDFLRVGFSIDQTVFYYFFSADILKLLSPDAKEQPVESADYINKVLAGTADPAGSAKSNNAMNEDDFSSLLNDSGSKGGIFSSSASASSLGEEFLKGNAPISDVEFPMFTDGNAAQAQDGGAGSDRRIDMLMDVQVDVSVELGSTSRTVAEVLDLGRGTILDLNKLAGEPLDIKVNNKLIAKGEVVVIDENFGVRIVEILSPKERIHR